MQVNSIDQMNKNKHEHPGYFVNKKQNGVIAEKECTFQEALYQVRKDRDLVNAADRLRDEARTK